VPDAAPVGTVRCAVFPCQRLAASTASARPVRVATDRPPEPFAGSASPSRAETRADASRPHRSGFTWRRHRDPVASPPRGSPPPVLRSVRPLPIERRGAGPSASSCHRGGLVPPSWFLTTSAVYSGPTARALLQPAADPGVHRVSRPPPLHDGRSRRSCRTAAGRCAFPTAHTPLEDAPCLQRRLRSPGTRERRSREGAAPVPLPPFPEFIRGGVADFGASFRKQVCHRRLPFPAADGSVLPWASILPRGELERAHRSRGSRQRPTPKCLSAR
jgi:hypothetical protein